MPCDSYGPVKTWYDEMRDVERQLCRARHLVLSLAAALGGNVPDELAPLVERERAAQLEHRREDRDAVLAELRKQAESILRTRRTILDLGGRTTIEFDVRQEGIGRRISDVAGLSDADLLESTGDHGA